MTNSTLSLRALNRALLARQLLLAREEATPVAVTERLVGLQAQVPRPPFVGLWTRIQGFERAQLLDALRKRTVVRATAMRATIHLLSASDYTSLRGAIQPLLERGSRSIARGRGADFDLETILADGRAFFKKSPSTFETLRDHLKKKYPKVDERAMAYAIRCHLPLVQVPTDAAWAFPASAEFTLGESWVGKPISVAHAEPDELVLRYLAAFGPATPADAQVWSGLSGLRAVFERLRPRLVTFRDDRKRELFDLPDAPRPPEDAAAPRRFVPEFDNLVLSHEDRTRVIADAHRPLIVTKNLQVNAVLLVDGFVAGKWTVARKKTTATVTVTPLGKIPKKAMGAIEAEGKALLQFLEPDANIREVRVAS
jgi:hypothetical protein